MAGAVVLLLVVVAVVLLIKNFLSDSDGPKKRKVQIISLVKPPEPPPPPPKPPEEKPPEQPKEEIKQEEQKQEPVKADSQPPGPSGPSSANGDPSFGFGPGGGGGSGSRYGYFAGQLQKGIIDQFNRNEKLRNKEYKLGVAFWIEKDGSFSKIELLDSTGDKELDALLKKELIKFKFEDLPEDYPKHIKLSINSR